MLQVAVNYSNTLPCHNFSIIKQSLRLIFRHSLETSFSIHGRNHPLSTVLRTVCNALHLDRENGQEVLTVLSVILASYERMLEVDHVISLQVKLELLRLTSATPNLVFPILRYWEQRGWFGSERMWLCPQYALSAQRIHRDYGSLQNMVEYVHSCVHQIKEEDVRWNYVDLTWEKKTMAYMDRGQWTMATETIRKRLLPEAVLHYGETGPQTVDYLLLLKRCLVEAGNWVQLEDVHDRLRYFEQRLEHGQEDGSERF